LGFFCVGRIRVDAADQREERRVQLRRRVAGDPDGAAPAGPDAVRRRAPGAVGARARAGEARRGGAPGRAAAGQGERGGRARDAAGAVRGRALRVAPRRRPPRDEGRGGAAQGDPAPRGGGRREAAVTHGHGRRGNARAGVAGGERALEGPIVQLLLRRLGVLCLTGCKFLQV